VKVEDPGEHPGHVGVLAGRDAGDERLEHDPVECAGGRQDKD
jgi:hypothetical protein